MVPWSRSWLSRFSVVPITDLRRPQAPDSHGLPTSLSLFQSIRHYLCSFFFSFLDFPAHKSGARKTRLALYIATKKKTYLNVSWGWVRSHHFVWRYKILKIHFPTLWRLYEVKVFPGTESFKLHTGVKIQQVVQKEVKTLSGHRVDSKSPCKWGKCHPLILGLASSPSTVDFLISAGFLACWTTFPSLLHM